MEKLLSDIWPTSWIKAIWAEGNIVSQNTQISKGSWSDTLFHHFCCSSSVSRLIGSLWPLTLIRFQWSVNLSVHVTHFRTFVPYLNGFSWSVLKTLCSWSKRGFCEVNVSLDLQTLFFLSLTQTELLTQILQKVFLWYYIRKKGMAGCRDNTNA